jgi:hypothetical protein
VITLGKGPIYAGSTRQRINTKSSTEAELVGVSDYTGQVIFTRAFLEALGYDIGPAQIEQDNQATLALIRNGRSNSSRTRHIATRYFFVADRVRSGEVVMHYTCTEEMVADILTKALVGARFAELRAALLNW